MRIVLLSQWCPPEPEFRVLNLGVSLVERGHDVTLITGFPNYPHGKIYDGYKQKLFQREIKNGVKLIRLPLFPDHSRSAIRRMATYLSFALSATMLAPFFIRNSEILWVYHPPLTIGIPAMWISFLRRIPFVYEIQDMWPETVAASGITNMGPIITALGTLASFTYRRAAAITVISKGFKSDLITKGVPEHKITVIPNWGDGSIYAPQERDLAFGQQHRLIGRFNIMFAGTMGPAQNLQIAIEAAEQLHGVPEIQFVFIGDGIDLPALKAAAAAKNLSNVLFIDRQPAERMSQFFAWGDAMLVQLRNDPLFHMTIPSKTLAYMACARFIICAVPGDGSELVEDANAGLICLPDDAEALANTIRQAYALPTSERLRMGHAGYSAFLQRFNREHLVGEYEALFRRILKR